MFALQGARILRSYWQNSNPGNAMDCDKYEIFPLEIWLRILHYSPISVHASMSKVSSTFRDIARRRLYHTLVIGDEDGSLGITGDDPTLDDATWVKSPQRFLESHSGHQDWKPYVRRVYVQCGESILQTRVFNHSVTLARRLIRQNEAIDSET